MCVLLLDLIALIDFNLLCSSEKWSNKSSYIEAWLLTYLNELRLQIEFSRIIFGESRDILPSSDCTTISTSFSTVLKGDSSGRKTVFSCIADELSKLLTGVSICGFIICDSNLRLCETIENRYWLNVSVSYSYLPFSCCFIWVACALFISDSVKIPLVSNWVVKS